MININKKDLEQPEIYMLTYKRYLDNMVPNQEISREKLVKDPGMELKDFVTMQIPEVAQFNMAEKNNIRKDKDYDYIVQKKIITK